jgi:hypothetical protein
VSWLLSGFMIFFQSALVNLSRKSPL